MGWSLSDVIFDETVIFKYLSNGVQSIPVHGLGDIRIYNPRVDEFPDCEGEFCVVVC
jgi:hypothetical protein